MAKKALIIVAHGEFGADPSKPDGTSHKIVDTVPLNAFGWHYSIRIKGGLAKPYADVFTQGTLS